VGGASHFLPLEEGVLSTRLQPGDVSAPLQENGFNRFLDGRIGKPLKRLMRGAR